ncbi:MAG: hypothetical protein HC906_08355 [Bacteroidales bacterium]|nr:hypothetical protein [Bacteroidales bacterium]
MDAKDWLAIRSAAGSPISDSLASNATDWQDEILEMPKYPIISCLF